MKLTPPKSLRQPDLGLLFLRVSSALLVIYLHGLPKIIHWHEQLQVIEDPLHFGQIFTLSSAIFAELICPLAIMAGIFTRLATLPLLFLLATAMLFVHADWSIEQGQFGWLLIIIFSAIALSGPGKYVLFAQTKERL